MTNDIYKSCPVGGEDWDEYQQEAKIVMQKVNEIHSEMLPLLEKVEIHTQHLSKLDSINGSIILLTDQIKELTDKHKIIIKWLLAVVCIIALGKGAIEVIEKLAK